MTRMHAFGRYGPTLRTRVMCRVEFALFDDVLFVIAGADAVFALPYATGFVGDAGFDEVLAGEVFDIVDYAHRERRGEDASLRREGWDLLAGGT